MKCRNKRIATIIYSYYRQDPRPKREAEELSSLGYVVDVFCLGKRNIDSPVENLNNVNIYSIYSKKKRGNIIDYFIEYLLFLIKLFIIFNYYNAKNNYDIIHVHNMPDFLVFIAIIPKILGKKIVLDMHDPTPEVYLSKFKKRNGLIIYTILLLIERLSIKVSDIVITPNIAFKELFARRSCLYNKVKIVMNTPTRRSFSSVESNIHNRSKFVIMFHGSIFERHGIIDSLYAIKDVIKFIDCDVEYHIYGDGDFVNIMLKMINKLNINNVVFYHGFVDQKLIRKAITESDIGIIPNKLDEFTEMNFPTRIFEYTAMKTPVVVPRTKGIRDYFKDTDILYFEPGNYYSLSESLLHYYHLNIAKKNELINATYSIFEKLSWEKERLKLAEIFRALS